MKTNAPEPLPEGNYKYGERSEKGVYPVCGAFGQLLWFHVPGYSTRFLSEEEAEKISKAVNNYEPMLKALEEINDLKAISLLPEHLYALITSIKTVANEAIQSAKGLT